MPSFPLRPSVQVFFSPSVRNQDWPSGITTGSHKLANYAFVSFATFCSSPLLPFCEKPGLAFRDHHWARTSSQIMPSFPLLPSVQVLFSPSVRNQDWPSGITTGSHKLANYAFVSFATFCSSPLLPFCEKPGLAFRDHHWARTSSQIMPSFPLLPSVQVLFSPSVRNQDWPSGITTGSHKLANYAFVSFATFCSSPLLPLCEKPGLAFRDHHWARTSSQIMPSFPLLPSVQVLFSPSVRNQDWPSGITTGSHKLANYAFVSFATFCSSPLLPFCEKPGLAFRDHHWLAQARKLCLRFLCDLLCKSSFLLL